jgi:hypothetical protein
MRTTMFVPTLLSVLLASMLAPPASSQTTGADTFDVTESAATGTYSCNGGATTAIPSADASTTDVSGNNDDQASNISAQGCGATLYSIASANDSTSASDTSSEDDGDGASTLTTVSLLDGVLTFNSKSETDSCSDSDQQLSCQGSATIQNVVFAGQQITGTFTSPTTFNAVDASVQFSSFCNGAALFTGTLTVAGTSTQADGSGTEVTMAPIALSGTLTCIGLPLQTMTVDIKDMYVAIQAVLSLEPKALDGVKTNASPRLSSSAYQVVMY